MRIETLESLFMFLLNNTNYKYSNSHDHYDDWIWMSLFTKDDIHTKALIDFCEDFSKKKKEAELAELGILPKSGIS